MKYTFKIAMEASVFGAITTVAAAAIASIVILSPSESKPASLAAMVKIFVVVHRSFNVARRKPSTK